MIAHPWSYDTDGCTQVIYHCRHNVRDSDYECDRGITAGNLRHISITVVQTDKLIFVGSKFAAPLNFAALFGRTPRTCLRPALSR